MSAHKEKLEETKKLKAKLKANTNHAMLVRGLSTSNLDSLKRAIEKEIPKAVERSQKEEKRKLAKQKENIKKELKEALLNAEQYDVDVQELYSKIKSGEIKF